MTRFRTVGCSVVMVALVGTVRGDPDGWRPLPLYGGGYMYDFLTTRIGV